jgi:excisionase family DNA binding protein
VFQQHPLRSLAFVPAQQETAMEQLLCSISQTCRTLDLGRTSVYELIKAQRLDVVRIGRRTLVKTDSIRRLIDAQA